MKPVDLPALSFAASITPSIDPEAVKMAYFSRLAYIRDDKLLQKKSEQIGYEAYRYYSAVKNAVILVNDKEIIVAHEGSRFDDTKAYGRNLNHFHQVHPLGNNVHAGFYNEINYPVINAPKKEHARPMIEAINDQIVSLSKSHPSAKIHFTGHSSGGAAAILQAAYLIEHNADIAFKKIDSIATFGQPRVGSPDFIRHLESYFAKIGGKITRYVIEGDLIPTLPPTYNGYAYEHAGKPHTLLPPQESKKPYNSKNPFRVFLNYSKSHHSIGSYYQSCLEALNTNEKEFFDRYMSLKKTTDEKPEEILDSSFFSKKHLPAPSEKEKVEHLIERLESHFSLNIPSDIQSDILAYKNRLCEIVKLWTPRTESASLRKAGLICANFAKLTKWIPESYDELKNLGEFA